MATLDNIRKRGPLLVGVIGVALVAFIAGDFINSGQTFLNRSREVVMKVNNDEVNINTFQAAVDQRTDVYKIEANVSNVDDNIQSQIRASVWESLLSEKLIKDEAQKLGITVSKEELKDRMVGNNIHPIVLQSALFRGEDGSFSREALDGFRKFIDENANSYDEQVRRLKNYWIYTQNLVENNILQEKYIVLLTKSITANGVDAKFSFEDRQKNFNFSYISLPYYSIADSLVSVSEKEISEKYNSNKNLFKQKETRSASYVSFEVKPQEDDYTRVKEWIDKLTDEFKTTDDIIALVNSNSDVSYDGRNYSETMLPDFLREFALSGQEGDAFGPIFENDTHTMARIVEAGILTSDSIRLSHIYISPDHESRADSIYKVLQNDKNADFAKFAALYSEMQQTAQEGGDVGWITENSRGLDKEFLNAFEKKTNDIFIIKNPGGTQILKITDKTAPRKKVKLAILQRKVEASSQTQGRIYNEAKQFAAESKNLSDFNRIAEEKGFTVLHASALDKNTERIADIPQTRQLVRWMNSSKVGAVSDVFDCDNQFLVAVLTEYNKEGFTPLEKVSNMVKADLLKDKKADYAAEKISKLSDKSLEGIANALNLELKEAAKVNFSSFQFGSEGFEPNVIGSALKQPLNTVSEPIKGNYAVFVVLPTTDENASDEEYNGNSEIENLNYKTQSIIGRIYEDLKSNSDIEDNRSNFY